MDKVSGSIGGLFGGDNQPGALGHISALFSRNKEDAPASEQKDDEAKHGRHTKTHKRRKSDSAETPLQDASAKSEKVALSRKKRKRDEKHEQSHGPSKASEPVTADEAEEQGDSGDVIDRKQRKVESLKPAGPGSHQQNVEDELKKAKCTVFVGNVPTSTITSKHHHSQLKKLFSRFGKVQSIRFRSVAFSEMLPRKAAFLEGKLHEGRNTVNAYVVLSSHSEVTQSLSLNGTIFLDRHLRVDSVAHPAKQEPKRCVFVGNLSFDAEEEVLWRHFGSAGQIEYVRIVRDAKTNLGKGFAYIQYIDGVSVDKALLLNGKKSPDGRELRVSPAKNLRIGNKNAKTAGIKNTPKKDDHKREKKLMGRAGGRYVEKKSNGVIEGQRAKPGSVHTKTMLKKKPRITDRTKKWKSKNKVK